jgi:hypothetical protein
MVFIEFKVTFYDVSWTVLLKILWKGSYHVACVDHNGKFTDSKKIAKQNYNMVTCMSDYRRGFDW